MSAPMQALLPITLFHRLQRIRNRYAVALKAAGAGDYTFGGDLHTVARHIGRLLATEARKTPEERGGLRMWDISLMVDQAFPEMRGWNRYEVEQKARQRIASEQATAMARSALKQEERAS